MTPLTTVVGKRVPRIDAIEKSTGTARYTGDIRLPGMLYGKIKRSPYPHARVGASIPPGPSNCPA